MHSAKEGGRTPTRVTSLEPEGTARHADRQGSRGVRSDGWLKVRPHETAGNGTDPANTGACTGIPIGTFRSDLSRRWSESAVPDVIPAWLKDARHHVPPWAESALWSLHGAGFRLPPPPDSNEDLLEPLRKAVCP